MTARPSTGSEPPDRGRAGAGCRRRRSSAALCVDRRAALVALLVLGGGAGSAGVLTVEFGLSSALMPSLPPIRRSWVAPRAQRAAWSRCRPVELHVVLAPGPEVSDRRAARPPRSPSRRSTDRVDLKVVLGDRGGVADRYAVGSVPCAGPSGRAARRRSRQRRAHEKRRPGRREPDGGERPPRRACSAGVRGEHPGQLRARGPIAGYVRLEVVDARRARSDTPACRAVRSRRPRSAGR